MSSNDHDHRGEYAREDHDHYQDYAGKRHDHHDLERADETAQHEIGELRADLGAALERIRQLEEQHAALIGNLWANGNVLVSRQLEEAVGRIAALEGQAPQARQLQLEADLAAADLAGSGYDRHGRGCQCPFCYYDEEPEEATQ